MKAWILSVSAVVMITAIITLVLPEGKIGKYIKSIFSLFIIFTIIKPLFYIKESEFDYKNIFYQNNIELQYDFIEYVSQEKINEYEKQCLKILENSGIQKSLLKISYSLEVDSKIKIEQVTINLKNSVIISDKEHIDIIKESKQNIASYLNIKEDLVKIYE